MTEVTLGAEQLAQFMEAIRFCGVIGLLGFLLLVAFLLTYFWRGGRAGL
jgi:hypothetical protein